MRPVALKRGCRPRLVFWELTSGCNLRCGHCRATTAELLSPDDLSLAECLRVVDELAGYAPLDLVLGGGEPLWRRDIFEIASHAAARDLRVGLATNGTLVDEAMAERIRAAGIERVAVSLDGASAETHDRFRGIPGAFECAVRGLRFLKEAGVSTQINTTATRFNAGEIAGLVEFAERLGADAFHLFLMVPVGCGLTIAEEDMLRRDEAERVLAWFHDRSRETSMELKATCAPHYYRAAQRRRGGGRRPGVPLAPLPTHGVHTMNKGCEAGTGLCFLSHQGEVYPCGYLPVSAGNLREHRFQEIWEHAEIFARLRRAGASGFAGLEPAPDCCILVGQHEPCPVSKSSNPSKPKSSTPVADSR